MPVDAKTSIKILARFCKMYVREFSGVNGRATYQEFLFEDAKLFEPLRELKSYDVLVDLGI